MADRVIYKCLRQDENGNQFIAYAPTKNWFELDTTCVSEIEFDANDMQSLCNALNSQIEIIKK